MKTIQQGLAHHRMCARCDQTGGLRTRHFLRKAGATQGTGQQTRRYLGTDFMRHQAHAAAACCHRFKALAQPGHGCADLCLGQRLQRAAQRRHGRGNNDEIHALHRLGQRCGADLQPLGKGHVRQIAGIVARCLHLLHLLRIACP